MLDTAPDADGYHSDGQEGALLRSLTYNPVQQANAYFEVSQQPDLPQVDLG